MGETDVAIDRADPEGRMRGMHPPLASVTFLCKITCPSNPPRAKGHARGPRWGSALYTLSAHPPATCGFARGKDSVTGHGTIVNSMTAVVLVCVTASVP